MEILIEAEGVEEAIVLVDELVLVVIELCKNSGINGDMGGDSVDGKARQIAGFDESTSWWVAGAAGGTAGLLDASIRGLVLFVGLVFELFELEFIVMYLYV